MKRVTLVGAGPPNALFACHFESGAEQMKRAPDPLVGSWDIHTDDGIKSPSVTGWVAGTDDVLMVVPVVAATVEGWVRMIGDDPGLENNLDMRAVPAQVARYHNPVHIPVGPGRGRFMKLFTEFKRLGFIPPGTPPPWAGGG